MDAAKAKYMTTNELEAKGAWIRYFKFVCIVWGLVCLGGGVWSGLKYLGDLITFYNLGNAILGVTQAIIYGLQAKAIQNVEYDLQKNLVRFFYFNTIAAPCWVLLGPLLDITTPNLMGGIGAFVVCAVFLLFSFQVKRVFENKNAFVLTAEDCA